MYEWTADVLEIDMRPVGDQFGALKSGRLRLRGCLRRVKVGPQDYAFPHIFSPLLEPSDTSQSGKGPHDISRFRRRLASAFRVGKRMHPVVTSNSIHTHNPHKGFLRFDEVPQNKKAPEFVYCLQLSIQRKKRGSNLVRLFEYGLVLAPDARAEGKYVREGIFSFPLDMSNAFDKCEVDII